MARFSFGIFGQNSDELISGLDVKISDDGGSSYIADKSGSLSYTITDNGDGTYYVDNLPQNLYTVYVGDSRQDELHNVFFTTEATNTHINDATKHREINDSGTSAIDLFSANKINTLLATKSATTHNHDADYSDINHNHDGDYADTGGNGITVTGTSIAVDGDSNFGFSAGKLTIPQSYSGNSYISPSSTIPQNLLALDSAIQGVDTSGAGSTKKVVLPSEIFEAGNNTGDEATASFSVFKADGVTEEKKIVFQFYKDSIEDYLHVAGLIKGRDQESSS